MIEGDSYNTLNLYIYFSMGAVFVYAVKEKMYGWPIIWTHRYSARFGPFSLIALDGRKLRQMGKEIKSEKKKKKKLKAERFQMKKRTSF